MHSDSDDGQHDGETHPADEAADAFHAAMDEGARTERLQALDETALCALLARIVERDEDALASLYDALLGRIHGLALRIVRRPELAEEVAEDVFWQVWRQAPRFDPSRGSAMAWITTMARSRALDALRRSASPEVHDDEALSATADEDGGESPFDALVAIHEHAQLHCALAALDAQPRQLLALAFFRGLSHEEIALHTDLPLGTVKSQIRRSLQTLRRTMDEGMRCGGIQ